MPATYPGEPGYITSYSVNPAAAARARQPIDARQHVLNRGWEAVLPHATYTGRQATLPADICPADICNVTRRPGSP